MIDQQRLTSLEICAGAGGQALGLECAGFDPVALVEIDRHACGTLRANRPRWNVLETDLLAFDPHDHPYVHDVDLFAAGLPRVRSNASVARVDGDHELALLKATIWLVHGVRPRAVLIENVPELATAEPYAEIRHFVQEELEHLGYRLFWRVLNASDFGVPQDRRQGVLVALAEEVAKGLDWPAPHREPPPTVGEALMPSMGSGGWPHAAAWAARAGRIAPAIVGGSKNRGGADLGPSGTKKSWARLGVNGISIGDTVPDPDFPWLPQGDPKLLPKLTVEQVAIIQGMPADWELVGGKTSRYRQLGHACPPPVATALGHRLAAALSPR
ncbi:DNA cytosine methyltransferase [Streptomyces meridianus]|uniref:DNA (cytosine-5-)-methyltransferase n=1 Tax=Streptomyces meridianus TaxID=2938945 RepID=A0ABT0WZX1_9ACTN|nr:DNA cytosine methyltransferase [Streptomyces meridianus]MCM2575860.1 DNA cytosine methyltransferase [Streptomyces meridianus]